MSGLWAALAPIGQEEETLREIAWRGLHPRRFGRLFLFDSPFQPLFWSQVNWRRAGLFRLSSIREGAETLRPLARCWDHLSIDSHRRGTLVQEQLRPFKRRQLSFPPPPAAGSAGAFALLSREEGVYLLESDRSDPVGVLEFAEDKSAPSRAYLKLWEALTVLGHHPKPGERCLDLGASPGGWTWVAAKLGATVVALDRAALAPEVLAMASVEFRAGDAFQALPANTGPLDWLFSDVICYPEKLLDFVETWAASGLARHMICTLKFQGEAKMDLVERFSALGRVLHLYHNKHELTWMRF
jgi:23S rRNA (cytidine2498-2'-O)-methyltransferase